MFSSISGKNNINTLTRHPKNVAFQSNSSPVMHSSAECFVLRSKLFQQHLFDPRVWPDESHFMQTLRHSLPAINIPASILASCSTHQDDLNNITAAVTSHFWLQRLLLSALKVTELRHEQLLTVSILVCSEYSWLQPTNYYCHTVFWQLTFPLPCIPNSWSVANRVGP